MRGQSKYVLEHISRRAPRCTRRPLLNSRTDAVLHLFANKISSEHWRNNITRELTRSAIAHRRGAKRQALRLFQSTLVLKQFLDSYNKPRLGNGGEGAFHFTQINAGPKSS
jgi:hypothetical protein